MKTLIVPLLLLLHSCNAFASSLPSLSKQHSHNYRQGGRNAARPLSLPITCLQTRGGGAKGEQPSTTKGGDGAKKNTWLRNEHDGDIAELAIPSLFSLLAGPVLSVIDTAYVGRLGPLSLAALGPCTSIFHFMFNSFRAMTQSTTSLISSNLATGDQKKAGETTELSLWLGTILGVIVGIAGIAAGSAMLGVMGAPKGTAMHEEALKYLDCRSSAAPAVLLLMVLEGIFRGYGNTRGPAIAAMAAAVGNLIMDPLLMFTFGYGIWGAAAATVASQYLAVAVYAVLLVSKASKGLMGLPSYERYMEESKARQALKRLEQLKKAAGKSVDSGASAAGDKVVVVKRKGRIQRIKESVPLMVTILGANAAMLLRTTSLMVCWGVATAVATRMGEKQVGAHQVALSLWLLWALVAEAPAVATQVLGARYLGQKRFKTARQMCYRAGAVTLTVSGMLGVSILLMRNHIPTLFTTDPVLASNIVKLMPVLAFQQPLVSACLVMEGMLMGAKEFRWLAVGTVMTTAFATSVCLTIGKHYSHTGVLGVWAAITVMFIGRFTSAICRLLDRKRGPYWGDHAKNVRYITKTK